MFKPFDFEKIGLVTVAHARYAMVEAGFTITTHLEMLIVQCTQKSWDNDEMFDYKKFIA